MASSTDNVAKLRVELESIQPLIWRRVAVPTSMKLNQLHHVVQAAMGWLDRHLWMLTAGDRSYGVFIPGEDDWNERIDDAETTTLATILSGGLKEFSYLYDFGDSWQKLGTRPISLRLVFVGRRPLIACTLHFRPHFLRDVGSLTGCFR
jgi:Plasmid pRiA4b ORF-3-like protein